ncbi:MAG: glycosyltransferase family 39 protein [Planctomycetes bacterium]|nr:glycosyltransferase family 39 protein [Planctomycetota bacterium]
MGPPPRPVIRRNDDGESLPVPSGRQDSTLLTRLVLLVILLGTGILHVLWNHLDVDPPAGDDYRYLGCMDDALDVLQRPALEAFAGLLVLGHPHPPALPLSVLPLYAAVGGDFDLTCAASVLYHLLGAVAMYWIGRRYVSVHAGLFMVALFALAPLASHNSRGLNIDGPLCALAALALFLSLRCEGFTRRWPSFLFGLVAGWMLLTKSIAIAFLAGPAVLALVEGFRRQRGASAWPAARRLAPGLLLTLPGILLAVPWYVHHLGRLREFVHSTESWIVAREPWLPTESRFELVSLVYYLFALDDFLGITLAGALLIGVGLFVFRKRFRTRLNAYSLATAAVSYVVLTVILVKVNRFYRPAAPALIAVASSWLFTGALRAGTRRLLGGFLLVTTAMAGLVPALGVGPKRPVAISINRWLAVTLVESRSPPNRRPWPVEEVLDTIDLDRQRLGLATSRVAVVPYVPAFNVLALQRPAQREGRPLSFRIELCPEVLSEVEHVVNGTLPEGTWRDSPALFRVQLARWLHGEYPPGPPPQLVEIGSGPLPNGLGYVIYRRTGELSRRSLRDLVRAVQDGWPAHLRRELSESGRPDPRAAPDDDGATKRAVIQGRSFSIWVAPPALRCMAQLDVEAADPAAITPAVLFIRGEPGAEFHLTAGGHRRRRHLGFGVAEIADPRTVSTGRLDSSGTAQVHLDRAWLERADTNPSYLQALLSHGDRWTLTNWVAFQAAEARESGAPSGQR